MARESTSRPVPHLAAVRDDDLVLARRAADGDGAARREIVARLIERVRTTVRYVSGGDRDQDDLVQLALVEILGSLRGFQGLSSLTTWADRITLRTARRQLGRRRRREDIVTLDGGDDDRRTATATTDDPHERLAMRRRLALHLDKLSPERREVITLRLVHGYSIDEIAALTDTPRNTVRDRLAQGRRQLEERLEKDPVFGSWVATVQR